MTGGTRIVAGMHWEAVAGRYLEREGLTVLARRYRCRMGELDLICCDGPSLVIVEVRARGSTARVRAAESVDYGKRARIIQATRHFLMRYPQWRNRTVRFDVVAIDSVDRERPTLDWIRGAFDAG